MLGSAPRVPTHSREVETLPAKLASPKSVSFKIGDAPGCHACAFWAHRVQTADLQCLDMSRADKVRDLSVRNRVHRIVCYVAQKVGPRSTVHSNAKTCCCHGSLVVGPGS